MEMKIGRRIVDITNEDIVVSNGAAQWIKTKTYLEGYHYRNVEISATQFKKLIKENKLVEIKKEYQYTDLTGRKWYKTTYRFNVE